ncbi:aquaporin-like protein [Lizonia empirigonia]|nr:aquaporin-like protein [Lizonia empirigonia]
MPRLPVHREPKENRNGDTEGHTNGNSRRKQSQLSTLQKHLVAASGEFCGTFMFLYFSFACQIMLHTQRSDSSIENGGFSATMNIYTALVYGFSLLVSVWAFYRISGGLFNPAVTFGMVLAGTLPPIRGLILFPVQLVAGIIAQGVFIEMFMTAQLVSVVLMLAAEKSKDTFIAPIGVGLALFVAMMGGVYYTGGSLNPTRSFGPTVAGTQFPGYHWIYWVGPFLGGALAAGYYRFVKHFNYEEANPGQDSDGE